MNGCTMAIVDGELELGGTFAGEYQQKLLDEFDSYLPEKPPWPVEE